MTPEEEKRVLDRVAREIEAEAEKAAQKVVDDINAGVDPRTAVNGANAEYRGAYAGLFAKALSDVLGRSFTVEQALNYKVGKKPLSSRIYANEKLVSLRVRQAVQDHVRGYQDARALARELYEGYDFRTDEPIKISRRAKIVPQYMKDALLIDAATQQSMGRAFAQAQAKALRTGALRAAYLELLDDIERIENGEGAEHLDKKVRVAYEEKVRYHANRIAQTELHREYAKAIALDMADDDDIQYVQYELAPTHPITDICDYFAGADLYGLGRGIYPKREAPVPPLHPFCRCQLSPRLDLTDEIVPKFDPGAQQRFFNSLSVREQKLVAGTKDNLEKLRKGKDVRKVWNEKRPAEYRTRNIGELEDGTT